MSDAEVEMPSTSFKKRNIKNRGGRKRKTSSSEEKNSSSSDDQTVVLPTKRPPKVNPNIQSTSAGPKKVKPEIEDNVSGSDEDDKARLRTTLSVQQQRENATATYEMDTERDRDAQAIFEKAQKINEELTGQADDKCVNIIKKRRKENGDFFLLYNKFRRDPESFFEYTRMSVETFDYILLNVKDDLEPHSSLHIALKAAEKLFLTFRYLGHGLSMRCLSKAYGIGRSTVAKAVYQTLQAIWNNFGQQYLPQPSLEDHMTTANDFYNIWQFPNCIGAINSMQFRGPILRINNRCEGYHFCATLQAISDANYKFSAIDVVEESEINDDPFFCSKLFTLFEENKFNVPKPENLPDSDVNVPYVLVGNEGYPLKSFLMRPFPTDKDRKEDKNKFNERLNHARLTVECAFGILTEKFQILSKKSMDANVEHAKLIIKICCLLHNMIRENDGDKDPHFRKFCTEGKHVPKKMKTKRLKIKSKRNNRSTTHALKVREQFLQYILDHPQKLCLPNFSEIGPLAAAEEPMKIKMEIKVESYDFI